jgi:type II secretory pathway pseudopilin PulG
MLREKEQHNSQERHRMQRSQRAREGGFTQIEIVLVIIIIGLLSAVAIARFPTIPKTGPAARRLARDIRYAKQLANRLQDTGGNPCCGIYFIDSTSYRIFKNNNTGTAAIDPATGGSLVVTLSGQFSGVTISQSFSGNTLKFNSLGTPLDGSDTPLGATATITVSGNGGNHTVTVEPNTGKVNES